MELQLSYILRRLVRYATCSVSTEHTEQQSNRATEHSAGHVTHRSACLGSGSRRTSSHTDLLPEASLQATAAIHIGIPLYSKLGISHGVSILGAMSVLGIPGMWFIYSIGPALRAKSRFAVSMIPEKTARQISAFA